MDYTITANAAHHGIEITFAAKPAQIVNLYGVKVGDIFHSSWGYDQTNNDFFQVVALCGKSSVRVREVIPASTYDANPHANRLKQRGRETVQRISPERRTQ